MCVMHDTLKFKSQTQEIGSAVEASSQGGPRAWGTMIVDLSKGYPRMDLE